MGWAGSKELKGSKAAKGMGPTDEVVFPVDVTLVAGCVGDIGVLRVSLVESGVRSVGECGDRGLLECATEERLDLDDSAGSREERLDDVPGGVVGDPVLVGDTDEEGESDAGDGGITDAVMT